MKKKKEKTPEEPPEDWEPAWMNPANDRKTPYTEEELQQFANDFLESMSDTKAVTDLVSESGTDKAKEIIKERFKKQDTNNLLNITVKGSKH